jgi:hypothetical protein
VPVLSLQIQLVDPKVSTDSKFFTKTFNLLSFYAVMERLTVIVIGKPSGIIEIKIPIAN